MAIVVIVVDIVSVAVMIIEGLQGALLIVGVVIILPGTLPMVEDQGGIGLDHPILLLLIMALGEGCSVIPYGEIVEM